jgi:ornithine carbamoyltransferase
VINALSDEEHPCQALADLLTIREHKGSLRDVRIAFIGDGNNVASSLAQASVLQGARFVLAAPDGYRLNEDAALKAEDLARIGGGRFDMIESPEDAVDGADVVYTDVWTSMGQEHSYSQRLQAFSKYQVTQKLLAAAKPDAIFMHDLPAHRGEEVTEAVIEGPQSVVFDQAENRLHAQRAVLLLLLGESE